MKTAILTILFFSLTSSLAIASEEGVLLNGVPFCEKRSTALSANIMSVMLKEKGATVDELNKSLEEVSCIYMGKANTRLKVHKMTQDIQHDSIIHYAQVSVISINGKPFDASQFKMWIAAPYIKEKGGFLVKLDNGKSW
ncbi:MAG: hypothetical protein Q3M24_14400 [Candidatus Electrothrix aestuarii]|uniref:Uncharacterized protein n=1 Tax=Candidatus Electrothrix aestuarii TaxID=3062594 RepID=A0AAU8LQX5_9BACT|nr:hypothetical protein [Candidatus Electrothrix aestuarii]